MSSPPSAMKDDNRKAAAEAAAAEAVNCPRCDSPNTKFCYYNNYSLTQPRHFCKTCRRYWTKGGALRNVPIGGGCRKNKKIKPSSSSGSRLSDSDLGPLKFFAGGGLSPAMDFQLGNYPRVLHHQYSAAGAGNYYMTNQFDGTGIGGYGLESSLMGSLNYVPPVLGSAVQEMNNNNSTTTSTTLASSIESLSCINQDLHWKLQQQRLAMLFGNNKDDDNSGAGHISMDQQQQQKQSLMTMQPILFQNLDISSTPPEVCGGAGGSSRKEGGGDVETEWFFGNSYANQSTGAGGDQGTRTWSTGTGGVQGWSEQNRYSALP